MLIPDIGSKTGVRKSGIGRISMNGYVGSYASTYEALTVEQIDKHHAAFGTAADSIPAADSTDELQSLKSIVLLLRTSLFTWHGVQY